MAFIFIFLLSSATALSFNYTSFDSSNHDIKYEGDASPLNSAILLTSNQPNLTGHASYYEPILLWDEETGNLASFTTNFTYSIDAQNNVSHSDGIAFFLANMHFAVPFPQQGSGIGLASGSQTLNSTANPFVAVEFDTNHNLWDDERGDHVGIDVNSLKSIKTWPWDSSLDGRIMDAAVIYNSTSSNFCNYFTEIAEGITVQRELCAAIDLRDYLPSFVYIGFSAATGIYSEFHRIHSWSFTSYFPSSAQPSVSFNPELTRDDYKALMIAGWSTAAAILLMSFATFGGLIWFRRLKNKEKGNLAKDQNPAGIQNGNILGSHQNGAEIESEAAGGSRQNTGEGENNSPIYQNGRPVQNEGRNDSYRRDQTENVSESRADNNEGETHSESAASSPSTLEIGVNSSSTGTSGLC